MTKDLLSLCKSIIQTLDVKGRAGCINPSWEGFQNGNGTEVGKDIETLIRKAKRLEKKYGTDK